MYSPTDLKKNTLITLDGEPYKVVEYAQKVMGRGGSIVNVRLKNLITGALIPKTFKGQDKIEPAEVTNRNVQYLYSDGEKFYFMDPNDFGQYEVLAEMLKVEYTENVVKGDTTSSVMKDAKLETGAEIKVPAFIKTGDVISVDTETYAYRERQK